MAKIAIQHFRYIFTGGLAAAVDFTSFVVLLQVELKTWIAAVFSFLLAALINFSSTAVFVFEQRPTWARFVIFFIFAIFGLIINVSVTAIAVNCFEVIPEIGKILGIGFAFVFNFFVNIYIVFPNTRTS